MGIAWGMMGEEELHLIFSKVHGSSFQKKKISLDISNSIVT